MLLFVCLCWATSSTAMLQAVRALMIVGIVLGVFGILVSIFALKCIRIGSMDDSAKAKMTLTSGILFIISGKHRLPLSSMHLQMLEQVVLIQEKCPLSLLNIAQSVSYWDSRSECMEAKLHSTEL